jgi:ABC-type multidrug transport system fused ATPase/permease subunit
MFKNLLHLKSILGKRNSTKVLFLAPFFLISVILETVSIGLIVPLISTLIDDTAIRNFLSSMGTFENVSKNQLQFYVLALFLLVYILKSLYSVLFFYFTQKFFATMRGDLHSNLYYYYLNSNYEFHLDHNRSELKRNIDEIGTVFQSYITPLLLLVVEVSITIGILALLASTEAKITIIVCFIIGAIASLTYFYLKPTFNKLGQERVDTSEKINRHLYEGLGAIKEVKILKKEAYFSYKFSKYMRKFLKLDLLNGVFNIASATFIEVIFVILAISLMFFVLISNNLQESLPVLALFALASIRILQSFKKIYLSLNQLEYSKESLRLVYRETGNISHVSLENNDSNKNGIDQVDFIDKIEVSNISYNFQNSEQIVLDKVSIDVSKNSSIAIIGESGSGKTTLVNIFLGLLEVRDGHFLIDGHISKNLSLLHNKVGYVPQNVYITDDSIAKNIAFGVNHDDIDFEKVATSLKAAHLFEFVSTLPNGVNTYLGEDGARMSGGQRQRLGIARALYNDPDIIVLDEVTASLDGTTEKAVMDVIHKMSKSKTIVIITHKINTIMACDKIYLLGKGKILDYGNYEDLYLSNQDFRNLADNH